MLQCALTGGIGSGKSTLADALEAQVPVLRADRLAAEVLAPGSEGLAAVVEHFGPGLVDEQGALDRAQLGRVVFADAQKKAALEAIVHPRVSALYQAATASLRKRGEALVVYEIPLLLETGRSRDFDCVITVTAPAPLRVARVVQRSGLTPQEVRARMAHQVHEQARIDAADFVVHNDADLESLQAQVPALLVALRERLAFKRSLGSI